MRSVDLAFPGLKIQTWGTRFCTESASPRPGPPVIFQEVVHSIETGEAGCDEQSVAPERPNGLSQECPMDGGESRAGGAHGDGRWRAPAMGSREIQ